MIRFEIEVPRKPICWCVRLSLFGETTGSMYNRLLLQLDLYLPACIIHETNIFYCTKVRMVKQKADDVAFPFSVCCDTQYWFVLGVDYKGKKFIFLVYHQEMMYPHHVSVPVDRDGFC